jgi:hypothetical protein
MLSNSIRRWDQGTLSSRTTAILEPERQGGRFIRAPVRKGSAKPSLNGGDWQLRADLNAQSPLSRSPPPGRAKGGSRDRTTKLWPCTGRLSLRGYVHEKADHARSHDQNQHHPQ